jgi:hypothetical protein
VALVSGLRPSGETRGEHRGLRPRKRFCRAFGPGFLKLRTGPCGLVVMHIWIPRAAKADSLLSLCPGLLQARRADTTSAGGASHRLASPTQHQARRADTNGVCCSWRVGGWQLCRACCPQVKPEASTGACGPGRGCAGPSEAPEKLAVWNMRIAGKMELPVPQQPARLR